MRHLNQWLLACAGVLYCSVIIEALYGFPLNVNASYLSELSAPGEPTDVVSRVADFTAGVLMLAVGWRWIRSLPRARGLALVSWGLVVLGVGSMSDASFRIPCSASASVACLQDEVAGPDAGEFMIHAFTSTIEGVGTFMVAIGAFLVVRRLGGPVIHRAIGWLAAFVVLASVMEGLICLPAGLSGDERPHLGVLQRIWVVALCLLIANLPRVATRGAALADESVDESAVELNRTGWPATP